MKPVDCSVSPVRKTSLALLSQKRLNQRITNLFFPLQNQQSDPVHAQPALVHSAGQHADQNLEQRSAVHPPPPPPSAPPPPPPPTLTSQLPSASDTPVGRWALNASHSADVLTGTSMLKPTAALLVIFLHWLYTGYLKATVRGCAYVWCVWKMSYSKYVQVWFPTIPSTVRVLSD